MIIILNSINVRFDCDLQYPGISNLRFIKGNSNTLSNVPALSNCNGTYPTCGGIFIQKE